MYACACFVSGMMYVCVCVCEHAHMLRVLRVPHVCMYASACFVSVYDVCVCVARAYSCCVCERMCVHACMCV